MNESQKQLLEDWFGLSEEELFDIIMMEDSSEEQMENAIIVLEEKFGYSHEEILEMAPIIAGAGRAILGAGSAIKKGYGAAKKGIGTIKDKAKTAGDFAKGIPVLGSVAGAGIDALGKAADIIGNNINPLKRDYVVRSLDDFLPGYGDRDRENAARKAADDEKEKKANQPLQFINKKQNESITGTPKMQKTFMQFREELTEEIFIEDLNNESLAYIIEDESFTDEFKLYTILELFERGIIELSTEDYIQLSEAALALPGPKNNSIVASSRQAGQIKDIGGKTLSSPKITGPSVAGTTLKDVGKSALKAAGRLAGKFGRGVTGLSVAKTIGDVVRPQLQKRGLVPSEKKDAFNLWDQAARATKKAVPNAPKNTPFTNLGKDPQKPSRPKQGTKPSSAPKASTPKPSSIPNKPEVVKKTVAPSQPKQTAKPAKPTTPVKKSIPSANKPSAAMNDLRQSVDKLRGTASAAATATNRAKTALSKVPGTGRMNKPTSRGGMSSSDIHSAIGKLGGEPTRATPRSTPTLKVPAQTRQGAPRASSSKPPAGGKWM